MSSCSAEVKKFVVEFVRAYDVPEYVPCRRSFRPGVDAIPYSGPWWGHEEIAAAVDSLMNGDWLAAGGSVRRFEQEFSKWLVAGESVMVNSGSSANLLMLLAMKRLLGWRDGDEVIVPVCTFPTTITAICQARLSPVFVDNSLDDLNPTTDAIKRRIGSNTRAVLVSPILGNPPNMEELQSLDPRILLDNCDGLGGMWAGECLNHYAGASTCSFYAAHHICCGNGGMVSSHVPDLIELVRKLATWGRDCTCMGPQMLSRNGACGNRFSEWFSPDYHGILDHRYVYGVPGFNMRVLDWQGAVGLVQLAKLDEIVWRRRENKARIGNALSHVGGVRVPIENDGGLASWFGVPVVCDSIEQRTRLVEHLEQSRIQTRPCLAGNLLVHPAFRHLGDYRAFPNATAIMERVFFMGCAPFYTEEALSYVESRLAAFKP